MTDVEKGKTAVEKGKTIVEKGKTVEYMFDDDVLKFWDKEKAADDESNFEEIDLNDLIDWDTVNNKAIQAMKEQFPKDTIFVDIDDHSIDDNNGNDGDNNQE